MKSVLKGVFREYLHPGELESITKQVVIRAKTKSLSSRLIVVTNDKLLKQSEKVKLARRDDASIFAQQLLLIRRKYKHRGIQLINPGDVQWLQIKEVCKLATEFCNEFQIALKEGYRIYCEMGIQLMKNYSLARFKNLHATIYQRYECMVEIQEDKWPQTTELIYSYYLKKVNEKIGWVSNNFKEDPTKYVYFVRVRKEAQQLNLKPQTYIDAQFAGLEWANAIPDPSQMIGLKATERLMKYCYENDITTKPEKKQIDFSKIKGHGKKNAHPNR